MGDVLKARKLKLSNSRKKFKELQELKKKRNEGGEDLQKTDNPSTIIDSMTNSSHSSVNETFENIEAHDCIPDNKQLLEHFVNEENSYINFIKEDASHCISTEPPIESNHNYDENPYIKQFHQDVPNICTEDVKSESNENNKSTQSNVLENHFSNIENLKQLSNEVAELIEPQFFSTNTSKHSTDLENRNLELAAMLEQEKINSEKNVALINDLKNKINQLENTIEHGSDIINVQSYRELNNLKEEVQSHLQTIGMLVAEKTELSINLNKLDICCKQKTAECGELQARLKASRSRVAELEKEIAQCKSEKREIENSLEESKTIIDTLTRDNQLLKEQKEELMQDLLETREKLKQFHEENLKLQQQHQEMSTKLSSANIKLQQITSIGQQQIENDLDKFTLEKFHLEKQLADLNQLLKDITKERDESVSQYQQYSQRQQVQLNSLAKEIERLQAENENLSLQERYRIKHINDLEKQIQNLQSEQVAFATDKPVNRNVSRTDVENVNELCVQLQMEKNVLEENYTKISNEKDLLSKELEAKNDSISQLESLVEQLQGNQPDSVKLLAAMESDKIAAARAVQQNKELKQQVESLQEVFLKLNNDKVELTEQLNQEIKNNKELLQKLQKTEVHLQTLIEAVNIKDRELMDLREELLAVKKQAFQNEHVNDLIKHYEVQDTTNDALQNELKQSKDLIMKLTNEINTLKQAKETNSNTLIENNNLHTRYLESETIENDETNVKSADKETKLEATSANDILDKEMAMKHLEEKFKRTMQDVADLKEEKQTLEHLILQLQGETETIGEYVALYHHQRLTLQQRALEKDQQLKQITKDRENLKIKLEQMDNLLRKLVKENKTTPETLAQIQNLSEDKSSNEVINNSNTEVTTSDNSHNEITGKILSLLSEIKSSSLVQPEDNVHHCACCSGQLIVV